MSLGAFIVTFWDVEEETVTDARKFKLVNLILRGFANYNNVISSWFY